MYCIFAKYCIRFLGHIYLWKYQISTQGHFLVWNWWTFYFNVIRFPPSSPSFFYFCNIDENLQHGACLQTTTDIFKYYGKYYIKEKRNTVWKLTVSALLYTIPVAIEDGKSKRWKSKNNSDETNGISFDVHWFWCPLIHLFWCPLREKCPFSKLFGSVFSCIRSE